MPSGPSIHDLPTLLREMQVQVQQGPALHHKLLYQANRPVSRADRLGVELIIRKFQQEMQTFILMEQAAEGWDAQAKTMQQRQDLKTFKGTLPGYRMTLEALLLAAERLLEHPRPLTGRFGDRNILHLPFLEKVVQEHAPATRDVLESLQAQRELLPHLDRETLEHLREVHTRQDRDIQVFLKTAEAWENNPDADFALPRVRKLQLDLQRWHGTVQQVLGLLP